MVIYKFPPEGQDEYNDASEQKAKMPDYIYVEEDDQSNAFSAQYKEYYNALNRLQKYNYSWGIRLACLFVTALMTVYIALMGLLFLFTGALAALMLFRSESANIHFQQYWRRFRRSVVIGLGTCVAIISPAFGFGIVVLYFMLHGDKLNDTFFSRFLNP